MRAHVYLRLSLDRSGDELGVTRQREDCERLIAGREWTRAAEHCDNDRSAAGHVPRPGFLALLAAIKSGEVDAVVAWSLDRLVRTARDRLALVEACKAHDVVIALVRGSDMDSGTPAGRLTLDVLGAVAQHEIEQKADRQRRAAQQAAERGVAPAGPRAFGYTAGRTALVPEEAAAIRDAYAAILGGATLAGVTRMWNRAGLLSPKDGTWKATQVKNVLLSPRNAALRTLNGEEVGKANWPAIVPEETFRAAARLLSDPARRRQLAPAGRKMLSGIARCGTCGEKMMAGTNTRGGPTYRCNSRGHVARAQLPVDEFISAIVVARLAAPDARDLLVDDTRPDVDALRADANAARARLDDIATMLGEGELTPAQARTANERARARLAAAETKVADAGRVDVLGAIIEAEDVAAAWRATPTDRQRAIVHTLMEIVIHPPGQGARHLDPNTIEITWKVEDR